MTRPHYGRSAIACVAILLAMTASAGGLRECLTTHRENQCLTPITLPSGTRVLHDLAYGNDPRQRLDVYLPNRPHDAPVILMVHGGGWAHGDKGMRAVVENKVARWLPRGFIVVCVNNRMLPDADPLIQAYDIARALAFAQQRADRWGGDRDRFVLMGHSAGAHLVALLAASPSLARQAGARPWLGTVLLDSAALDVAALMRQPHLPLYDAAFGADPADWQAMSPFAQMTTRRQPMLAICSTRRTESCAQASAFVGRAKTLGTRAALLPENLSHHQINAQLGVPGRYTVAVEAFLAGLDPGIARRLGR